jgi:hypothetical protein
MINPSHITKEAIKNNLEIKNKDFKSVFVSGSNLHPNPILYKYYWWIYSLESEQKSANDVFYKKAYRINTKEFEEESKRLQDNKISFAYINIKLHRLNTIFDYRKLKEKYPDMEFAPAYEDDNDEIIENGHK